MTSQACEPRPDDGIAFRAYVEGQLAPALRPGQVVIEDNLGAHRTRGVREAIEGAGAKLMYPLAISRPQGRNRSSA
jgi:hypothetical protein